MNINIYIHTHTHTETFTHIHKPYSHTHKHTHKKHTHVHMYSYCMDPNFAKMAIECGIIKSCNLQKEYTECTEIHQYKFCIYSIMDHPHTQNIININQVCI